MCITAGNQSTQVHSAGNTSLRHSSCQQQGRTVWPLNQVGPGESFTALEVKPYYRKIEPGSDDPSEQEDFREEFYESVNLASRLEVLKVDLVGGNLEPLLDFDHMGFPQSNGLARLDLSRIKISAYRLLDVASVNERTLRTIRLSAIHLKSEI